MTFVLPVTAPVATTALVLAQQPDSGDNGGQGEDFGKSSPVGFLLLLVFLVAVAFLVRSMTKHLKRVPSSFDPADEQAPENEQAAEGEQAEDAGEPKVKAAAAKPEKGDGS